MRTLIAAMAAFALLIGSGQVAFANCTDDDPDGSKTAAARLTAEQNCEAQGLGCSTAPSHGAYVSCIAHEAKALSTGENAPLPVTCRGAVKRCAAKSVCGKQDRGFTTCCITTDTETKCKIKRGDTLCTDAGGTPSTCGSCCDACNGGTGPTCPAG